MITLEIGGLYKAPNYHLVVSEHRLKRWDCASRRLTGAQNIAKHMSWEPSAGGIPIYANPDEDKPCKAWVIPCEKPFLVVGRLNDHYEVLYDGKLGWAMLGKADHFKNFVIKEVKAE